ncbi:hypothetical protein ACFCYB_42695 [Streptomyces sp. NPDC056309]|uniref:hypothetical protein n=1 Tax=unclassified Streptomyces TaxID=2593676 RepID=UPI0035D92A7C
MPPSRNNSSRPDPPPTGLLDWTSRAHWSDTAKPCRYCAHPTWLRDRSRKPAHKVCAEAAIAQQAQEYAEAWQNERFGTQ